MDQGGGKKKRKKPTAKSKTRLRPKRVKSRRAQRVLNHRVEKRRRTLRGPAAPRPPPPVNYGSLGSRLSDALSLAPLFKQPTPKKKKEPKPPSIEEIVKAVGAYKQPLLDLYEKSAERLRNAAPSEMAEAKKLAQQKLYIKEMIKNTTGDVRTALEDAEKKIDTELEVTLTRAHYKEGATILDEMKRTEAYQDEVKQAIDLGVSGIQADYKKLQDEKEKLSAELAQKGADIMAENAENEDLRGSIDDLRKQKSLLEQELEQMKQRADAEEKAKTDLAEADMVAKEDAKEETLKMEEELKQLREKVEELDEKTRQVDELTNGIEELQKQLEAAKAVPREAPPEPPTGAPQQQQGPEAQQPAPRVDPVADDKEREQEAILEDVLKNISPLDTSPGRPMGSDQPTAPTVPPEVVVRPQATQSTVTIATSTGPAAYEYKGPTMVPAGTVPAGGVDAVMTPPGAAAAPPPATPGPPTPKAADRRRRPTERTDDHERARSVKRGSEAQPEAKSKQPKTDEHKRDKSVGPKRQVEQTVTAEEEERARRRYLKLLQKRETAAAEFDHVVLRLEPFEKRTALSLSEKEMKLQKSYRERLELAKKKLHDIEDEIRALGKIYGWSGSGRSGKGDGDGTTDQELDSKMHKFVPRGFSGVIASDEIKDLKDDVRRGPETSFIMNLDDHTKSGSHWVPVYIRWTNTKSGGPEVDYADSFGDPPSKETVRQLKELVKARRAPYMLKMKVNRIKSQREDSDTCGGHSMRFLHDMYDGKTFKEATGYTVAAAEKLAKRMEGRGGVPRFDYI